MSYDTQLSYCLLLCDGDKRKATTMFMAGMMVNDPRSYKHFKALLAAGHELKFPSTGGDISLREGPGLPDHVTQFARRNGRWHLVQDGPIPAERAIEPAGKNRLSADEMAVKFRPDLKIIPKRKTT